MRTMLLSPLSRGRWVALALLAWPLASRAWSTNALALTFEHSLPFSTARSPVPPVRPPSAGGAGSRRTAIGARMALLTGDSQAARRAFQADSALAAGDAPLAYLTGRSLWTGGHRAEAMALLTRAPATAMAFLRHGQQVTATAGWAAGAEWFRLAAAVDPTSPSVQEAWGQAMMFGLGDPEGAIRAFRSALGGAPGNHHLHLEIAQALQMLGRQTDALQEIERLPPLEQQAPLALAIAGNARLADGDVTGAIRALGRAVEGSPTDPWYWWSYAEALCRGGHLLQAQDAWRRADGLDRQRVLPPSRSTCP